VPATPALQLDSILDGCNDFPYASRFVRPIRLFADPNQKSHSIKFIANATQYLSQFIPVHEKLSAPAGVGKEEKAQAVEQLLSALIQGKT